MKRIILAISLLLPVSAMANQVVAEGKFNNLKCSAVEYDPMGGVSKTHTFSDDYFDDMGFSITKDKDGYKMTTALYSGQFIDIYNGSDKHVFTQWYNNGSEIATIVVKGNVVTYTNTSGSFYNRLCVGKVSSGINTY